MRSAIIQAVPCKPPTPYRVRLEAYRLWTAGSFLYAISGHVVGHRAVREHLTGEG